MTPPRYQPILARDIPTVAVDGGGVRIIAGSWVGTDGAAIDGPAKTFTPVTVWDADLAAGGRLDAPIPAGWTVAVAVLSGSIAIDGREVGASRVAVLSSAGDRVEIAAGGDGARFLVLAGEPIDEPIVAHGPFVMNTREEIRAAIADHTAGRMGVLTVR
jgi:redox-sensitive bicupin YhaK (pirin superfamily)